MPIPNISISAAEIKQSMDGLDRISAFPDDVLHHILSFLRTKHAAQSCLLSRRWRHLWKFVNALDFDVDDFSPPPHAGKVLDLGIRAHLTRFHGNADADFRPPGLRRIGITIAYPNPDDLLYYTVCLWAAPYPYRQRSVRLLKGVRFNWLQTLSLSDVDLRGSSERLISCCPVLEDLSLVRCDCDKLTIRSDEMKHLLLHECHFQGNNSIIVSAPRLVSLIYNVPWEDVALVDISSLASVSFNCAHRHGVKTLNVFRNVRVLTLDGIHLEVLYEDSSAEPLATFHNLKSLTVNVCDPSIKVHGRAITLLLHHSPILERLAVDHCSEYLYSCKRMKRKRGDLWQRNMPLSCFNHLKVAEFRNFGSSAAEVELLKFLSRNMRVAERIIIIPPKCL